MTKATIVIGLTLAASALTALAATPALAGNEFTGKSITAKGGEVVFTFSGGTVTCLKNSGKGSVISKTKAKIEVIFEECTADGSKLGTGLKATISTCSLAFNAERSVTLESGCVAETEAAGTKCVITPGLGKANENVGLKEVGYYTAKAVETLETEIYMRVSGLSYKVSAGCEAVGVKSGKEGEIETFGPMVDQGIAVNNERKFEVKAVGTEARKVGMRSTNTQVITLVPNTKTVKCGEVNFFGSVGGSVTVVPIIKFTGIKFTSCKTNLLGVEEAAAVEASAGCEAWSFLLDAPTVETPHVGLLTLRTAGCQTTVKVMTCVVSFGTISTFVDYSNMAGTPTTVVVKFSAPGRRTLLRYTATNCPGLTTKQLATYTGESIIEAEATGGTLADVKMV